MTNNPTIDGVSRELLERLLTDACNENWSDLNELLHSPDACRCRRFGKDNPHWPCPVHSAQGDPTAAMTEAGCQAYMDADGMIGIMHNSSMGHAYVAMRAIDPEFIALQSTIARLEARITQLESEKELMLRGAEVYKERIVELESGRGEPVACAHEWTDDGEFTLTCTKCGKTENHEPYGWVQTRGNAINHFTQEWDVVESWEDQGFEYKAMFDHADTPAPVAAPTDLLQRLAYALSQVGKADHLVDYDAVILAREDLRACLDATAALNGADK